MRGVFSQESTLTRLYTQMQVLKRQLVLKDSEIDELRTIPMA